MATYHGIPITGKTDAEVATQMAAVDAGRVAGKMKGEMPSQNPLPQTIPQTKENISPPFGTPTLNQLFSPSQENDFLAYSTPVEAQRATQNISARTNNLIIPDEPPTSMQVPGYLTDQNNLSGDWTQIAESLKTMADQQPLDTSKILEEQYSKWGIPESFQLLQDLSSQAVSVRKEYDALKAEKRAALNNAETQYEGRLSSAYQGEAARIAGSYEEREANLAGEIASYAAQAQMVSGNIQLAKSLAGEIVSAATYSSEQKWKRMEDLYTLQYDFVQDLNSEERQLIEDQRADAKLTYTEQKNEKKQIVDWATSSSTAPAFYGVNLSTISLEDATNRVNQYLSLKNTQETFGYDTTSRFIDDPSNLYSSTKNPFYGMKASDLNSLLSVAEAKSLKVPYGTTKGQAMQMKKIPAGTSSADDEWEKY